MRGGSSLALAVDSHFLAVVAAAAAAAAAARHEVCVAAARTLNDYALTGPTFLFSYFNAVTCRPSSSAVRAASRPPAPTDRV